MCRALIAEAERRKIKIKEGRNVVSLLTVGEGRGKRAAGAVAVNAKGRFEVYGAENVVFAVGGPGGLYKTSVYPAVQTGAIGLALMAGAKGQSLPESQYGMASVRFRWNVSGTYMQVMPRFISTDADGNDEQEFLRPYFKDSGEMNSRVFLKGYQWPFDPRKVVGGSSLVDILVYIETVVKGRRVFLDYRSDPADFDFKALSDEARTYLANSKALAATPIKRLEIMNPGAIQLYKDHNIDIRTEPLEIAVCAQHNNGGLAANHWWESVNLKHLFPVGEVNGSHGVYRPGGSALNAGQVGSLRAAEFIAKRYGEWTVEQKDVKRAAEAALEETLAYLNRCRVSKTTWKQARSEMQARMTEAAAHIRAPEGLKKACAEARAQWKRLSAEGCGFPGRAEHGRGAAQPPTLLRPSGLSERRRLPGGQRRRKPGLGAGPDRARRGQGASEARPPMALRQRERGVPREGPGDRRPRGEDRQPLGAAAADPRERPVVRNRLGRLPRRQYLSMNSENEG